MIEQVFTHFCNSKMHNTLHIFWQIGDDGKQAPVMTNLSNN